MSEATQTPEAASPSFEWTPRRLQAAADVAEDLLTDKEIARRAGVTRAALHNWKTNPEFAARVNEFRQAMLDAVSNLAIANKELRIHAYNDRRKALLQIVRERAAAHSGPDEEETEREDDGSEVEEDEETFAGIPGMGTGYVVRRVKSVGKEIGFEYEVDTGLLAELRALETQAAKELGQLEKDSTVNVYLKHYEGFNPEDV